MSTRSTAAAATLVVSVAILSLAGAAPKTLSATGFVGRSGQTTVLVDTDPALHHGSAKFMPLLVWVGHQESRTLKATRASFTLLDPQGGRQALAEYSALRREYGSNTLSADHQRLRLQDVHYAYGDMEFLYGRRIPRVAFFPDPSGPDVLYDNVELGSRTWFRTLLYFPNPAGRDSGVYTLLYEDPGGGARVEVPFTVNWAR